MYPNDCPSFFDCGDNKNLTLEQVFKLMVVEDVNGCPTFKVKTDISLDVGELNVNVADLEALATTLNSIVATEATLLTRASEATVSAINTKLTPIVRTPTFISASGVGTVTAGKRSVSFFNSGLSPALVLGTSLPRGAQINFDAGGQGDTLSAIGYDGTGTTLLITTIV